jgi:hypothetical protein
MSRDEKFSKGLESEDDIIHRNKLINEAHLIVTINYYPWCLPFREKKSFGFKSTRGSDNHLYWYPYEPQAIDTSNTYKEGRDADDNLSNFLLSVKKAEMIHSISCASHS